LDRGAGLDAAEPRLADAQPPSNDFLWNGLSMPRVQTVSGNDPTNMPRFEGVTDGRVLPE
jgi:hypothetical protein